MKNFLKTLTAFSKKQPFLVGWHLKYCGSGEELGFNAEKVFSAGSVRKIFILMAAFSLVYQKKISLKKKIKITKKYQNNRSGVFRYLTPGFDITFGDALVMMIIVSDNTCTGIIVDLLGLDYINAYIQKLHLKHTKIMRTFPPLGKGHLKKYADTTTPYETGYLLDLIARGAENKKVATQLGCSPYLCRLALDILSWQQFNNKLPAQLPARTKVAHKTGTREGVVNDAGIIYRDNKPLFVLSVFTSQVPEQLPNGQNGKDTSVRFIGKLSRMCWDKLK